MGLAIGKGPGGDGSGDLPAGLEAILDGLPQLVWTARPDGGCEHVNRRWIAFAGGDAAQCHGDGWLRHVHPDDRVQVAQRWRADIAAGLPFTVELRLRRLDGVDRWFDVTATPSPDPGLRWVCSATDVSARREHDAIRLNELRAMMEMMPGMVWIKDTHNNQMRVNQLVADATGCTVAAIEGLPAAAFYPDDAAKYYADDLQVIESGLPKRGIVERQLGAGGERWLRTDKVPFHDTTGAVVGIVVSAQDITVQQRTDAALRFEQELRHRTTTMSMVGGWELDVATGAARWTEEVSRIHDLEPSVPVNLELALSFYRGEHRARVEAAVARAVSDGTSFDLEAELITAKGVTKWVRSIGQPVVDAGSVTLLRGAFQDVTARRQADLERQRLEGQLVQAQRLESLGQLSSGIAHDFNNILAVIVSNVGLALDDIDAAHPANESLIDIATACERAKQLIRQILIFARNGVPERRVMGLTRVVEESVRLLRSTLPAGVELVFTHDPETSNVLADATQIQQVVMNLGTNAWHALGRAPGRIEITLSNLVLSADEARAQLGAAPGSFVRLSVTDNGSGMDAATLERVFDPFFTTKEPGQGTGLGLSVVHGIMQSGGGVIRVATTIGHGTRFDLYFPAQAARPGRRITAELVTRRGHGEHILYVDDEPALLSSSRRALERLGYLVSTYADAATTLTAFRATPATFAAVVTDLNMPGMSGLDLVRELLALRPELPTLLLSGRVTEDVIERARQIGVVAVLQKPLQAVELSEALHQAISRLGSHAQ